MIYVIGVGIEGRGSLSSRAMRLIDGAGLLGGGARHLAEFPGFQGERIELRGGVDAFLDALSAYLERSGGRRAVVRHAVVLATGDPLLFGIAERIIERFGEPMVEVIPNVSIVQEAFARIKRPEKGLAVVSVHGGGSGRGLDGAVRRIAGHERIAVFTDRENTPSRLARALLDAGLAGYRAYVCERLGMDGERIWSGTLRRLSMYSASDPNIVILEREGRRPGPEGVEPVVPGVHIGLPVSSYRCRSGLVTAPEVRLAVLSRLELGPGRTLWDIGAGCGSVAVEAALLCRPGRVVAVEKEPSRVEEIKENARRFGAANVEVVEGRAPACLSGLPAPDAVFVGGGGADAASIMARAARRLKAGSPLVVNAVTVETLSAAAAFFSRRGWEWDVTSIAVSRTKELAGLKMMKAENTIHVVRGRKPDGGAAGGR